MSIQLSSQTVVVAPNSGDRSRRTLGVGEGIRLTANQPVHWIVQGNPISGPPTATQTATFDSPGTKIIRAEKRNGEQAMLQFNVVLPSVAVQKVQNAPTPAGVISVTMELQFILTPLEVSFAGLEFRELDCPATNLWGYFAANGAKRHVANPAWAVVNARNQLVVTDTAEFKIDPSRMSLPLSSGGYDWQIPAEIRMLGTRILRLPPMVQTTKMDPAVGCTAPPFRGTLTIWKGGQSTARSFS